MNRRAVVRLGGVSLMVGVASCVGDAGLDESGVQEGPGAGGAGNPSDGTGLDGLFGSGMEDASDDSDGGAGGDEAVDGADDSSDDGLERVGDDSGADDTGSGGRNDDSGSDGNEDDSDADSPADSVAGLDVDALETQLDAEGIVPGRVGTDGSAVVVAYESAVAERDPLVDELGTVLVAISEAIDDADTFEATYSHLEVDFVTADGRIDETVFVRPAWPIEYRAGRITLDEYLQRVQRG